MLPLAALLGLWCTKGFLSLSLSHTHTHTPVLLCALWVWFTCSERTLGVVHML